MMNVITQFGDSSSGIGALGLNLSSFLIQLGTFIIAFLVLRKWAFKPILKVLNERRETIEQGVSLGEKMQKEQAEMEQKVVQALNQARQEADKIIADASDRGRQVIADAEAKAKEKSDNIITGAEERIDQNMKLARSKLEKELAGLVAEATEAIIDEKVDASKDAALINKALKGRA
ncbi:MAG TPA: F0F1 ATP synthase subunit B [Candidatus Saccharimonadales bacterium]|nr:F0F1 ATP synthase subunit B [Candidatus Saccharimonadales bacterium]